MQRFAKSQSAAIAALAVLSFLWGYNWVVVKVALQYAGPFQFLAFRMTLASLVLFGVGRLLGLPLAIPHPRKTLLLGLMQTTAYGSLMTWALLRGGAGKVAVLTFTMPFWVVILAWLFLGEKVRGRQWPIIFLALCGMVLIVEPWHLKSDYFSNLLAVGGGLCWAVSVLQIKKIKLHSQRELFALTAWQMILGSIGLIAFAFIFPSHPIHWELPLIVALSYSVIIAAALGWVLWLFVLQRLPANISSLGTLAIPVIGTLGAWLQLHDAPTRIELAGIFLISVALAGLALTAESRKSKAEMG